jgi:hypothetical protein
MHDAVQRDPGVHPWQVVCCDLARSKRKVISTHKTEQEAESYLRELVTEFSQKLTDRQILIMERRGKP